MAFQLFAQDSCDQRVRAQAGIIFEEKRVIAGIGPSDPVAVFVELFADGSRTRNARVAMDHQDLLPVDPTDEPDNPAGKACVEEDQRAPVRMFLGDIHIGDVIEFQLQDIRAIRERGNPRSFASWLSGTNGFPMT